MTTVERNRKLNIQISLNPFLLFVLASVLVHGLGLGILILSQRSQTRQKTESTPIDFVVVPPEESLEEPPPNTERRAVNNSVAQGKVEPELPSATSEPNPVTPPDIPDTPAPSVAPQTPTSPKKVEPTPKSEPQAVKPSLPKEPKTTKTSPAVATPTAPPEEVKPIPPLPIKPEPIAKTPSVRQTPSIPKEPKTTSATPATPPPEEIEPTPSVTEKPEPIPKTPLLSESGSTSIPVSKPTPPAEETPPKEIETTPQPELPPVATNSTPPKPKPTETSPVPESQPTPSEQQTPVGSGSASLLQGTQSRSLAQDSESFFSNPQDNASQQALNPSGVDAQQDLDLAPYFDEIRRRVRRNWQPSAPSDSRQTVLAFSIERNGQITGLQIRQSSGSPEVDRQSLEAVQNSGPFAPLPANFPQEQLDVEFNFNIYVNQGVSTPDLESWQRF